MTSCFICAEQAKQGAEQAPVNEAAKQAQATERRFIIVDDDSDDEGEAGSTENLDCLHKASGLVCA